MKKVAGASLAFATWQFNGLSLLKHRLRCRSIRKRSNPARTATSLLVFAVQT